MLEIFTSRIMETSEYTNLSYFCLSFFYFLFSRILKFSPDRTTGVILFSTSWNQGISAMFIDATGSVLASTPTSLIRWFPQWNGYITLMGLSQNGFSRLSMDRFGNLFGLISSGSNLLEYDLISNYC